MGLLKKISPFGLLLIFVWYSPITILMLFERKHYAEYFLGALFMLWLPLVVYGLVKNRIRYVVMGTLIFLIIGFIFRPKPQPWFEDNGQQEANLGPGGKIF